MALSSPTFAEAGWTGYFYNFDSVFYGFFFLPIINNRTFEYANSTFQPFFEALPQQEGIEVVISGVFPFPSFFSIQQTLLPAAPTGNVGILGSRLIPKAVLNNPTTREKVVDVISSLRNLENPPQMLGNLVAGGAVSIPTNSAILPAWRTACWHMIVSSGFEENATAQKINDAFRFMTEQLVEPLRKLTPGGGAYMNEADSQAPHWKEDFFGVNYGRLLGVKVKYDLKGLLKCNRCVGSDL
jgi:hypothetical protein